MEILQKTARFRQSMSCDRFSLCAHAHLTFEFVGPHTSHASQQFACSTFQRYLCTHTCDCKTVPNIQIRIFQSSLRLFNNFFMLQLQNYLEIRITFKHVKKCGFFVCFLLISLQRKRLDGFYQKRKKKRKQAKYGWKFSTKIKHRQKYYILEADRPGG